MKGRHFVYFVHQPAGCLLKIGVTSDLTRRLSELRNRNPNILHFLGAIESYSRSEAEDMERWLLLEYSKYSSKGEWFAMSLEEVNRIGMWLSIIERAPRTVIRVDLEEMAVTELVIERRQTQKEIG